MSNEIQKAPSKQLTIRDRLDSPEFRSAVAKALPRHLTPDRFIRVACTTVMRTPKLANCDQTSFFNALLTLSQLGIEADGRRAHLIPFENRNRGVTEVQLIIDYKGLAELAMRSGVVSFLHADVVCENDEFDYNAGQLKAHKVNFRQSRGPVYAVYSLCRFKDGSEKCDVMTREEVESVRGRSRAGKNGPWVSDWNEMAKKTVFRRLSKWLPLSPEFRDAIDADDDTAIEIAPTQSFEIEPKKKPNLGGKKAKAIEPEVEPISAVTETVGASEPAEQVAVEPADVPGNPDDNNSDGDLGPQTQPDPEFSISDPLRRQLEGFEVPLPKFRKWAKESGWDKKFLADSEAASKELIAASRSFKHMLARVETYTE